MRRWHAELAWLARPERVAGRRLARDVLIEAHGDAVHRRHPRDARRAAAAGHGPAAWPDAARPGERALARVPPRAARLPRPGRRRHVLDLAGAHVRGRGAARPGALLRARPRRLRRDGAGRDHLRRGVPLPASRPGRTQRTAIRTRSAGVLITAAAAAGLRITLLDTCYLAGGFAPGGEPAAAGGRAAAVRRRHRGGVGGAGLRRSAATPSAWRRRTRGSARRSTRSARCTRTRCPRSWPGRTAHGAPVHAHLSEQPLENAECRAAFGGTPAEVLYEAGALGPRSTLVHATHLTERDIDLLGGSLYHGVHVPAHRGRPGRRRRARPRARRRRVAAGAGQRRAQRHRPDRGGTLARAVAAPGDQAARALQRAEALAAAATRQRARLPGLAGRRRDRAWRVRRPRDDIAGLAAACRRPRPATRWPRCSRPGPRRTSGTSWRPASTWSATGATCWWTDVPGELAAAISAVLS